MLMESGRNPVSFPHVTECASATRPSRRPIESLLGGSAVRHRSAGPERGARGRKAPQSLSLMRHIGNDLHFNVSPLRSGSTTHCLAPAFCLRSDVWDRYTGVRFLIDIYILRAMYKVQ